MRHIRRTPVHDCQIDPLNLRKMDLPRLPLDVEVMFGAVVAVPDVVNGYGITFAFGICSLSYIRLPLPIVRWSERQPPAHDQSEGTENRQKFQPFAAGENYPRQNRDDKSYRRDSTVPGQRKVVVK